MKSFKEFFIIESKKKKPKETVFKPRAGIELYTRKAGAMQDKKSKDRSNQRKRGKDQAKRAMRGEID